MAFSWLSKTFTHLEIGFASIMQSLADADAILRDVIKGDNGESSGWTGHSHGGGSTWASGSSDLGKLATVGSQTLRGVVFRKELSKTASSGGGTATEDFPTSTDANASMPCGLVRWNHPSHTWSEWAVGHTSVGAYNVTRAKVASKWRTTVTNYYGSSSLSFQTYQVSRSS